MEMGDVIYKLRKEKGLTLEELGIEVGVGKSTIRKWEKGIIANMKRDKIAKLAKALGVTPSYLMGWDELVERADEQADAMDLVYENEDLEKLVIKCRDMDSTTIRRMLRYADLLIEEDEL